jgi:hypothetical protein
MLPFQLYRGAVVKISLFVGLQQQHYLLIVKFIATELSTLP